MTPWSLLLALAALGGCGGRVAVDDQLECSAPPPVESLVTCHGAVAVGDGEQRCSDLCLDQQEHEYLSVCTRDRCECWYDGQRICECEQEDPGAACRVDVVCCPAPWL